MVQPKDKKDAARTMRRLIAAGFTPPTVFKVLRKWVPDEDPSKDWMLARNRDSSPLSTDLMVEREYQPENQEVLSWC